MSNESGTTTASRRQFLQGASLSAAAFSIIQPQSVRGTQANSAITVGLIGCGGRGTYDTGQHRGRSTCEGGRPLRPLRRPD